MNDKWLKFTLAITVPLSFVLVLVGVMVTRRQIDPTVAGGLIAILGAIVALFTVGETRRSSNPGKDDDTPTDPPVSGDVGPVE